MKPFYTYTWLLSLSHGGHNEVSVPLGQAMANENNKELANDSVL